MKSFSQRLGFTPVKTAIQVDSMDTDLKNALWNIMTVCYFNSPATYVHDELPRLQNLYKSVWLHFFKYRYDKFPSKSYMFKRAVEEFFYSEPWYRIYDLLEFIASCDIDDEDIEETQKRFIRACNTYLEKELSGYRFINKTICPIIDEVEVQSMEDALGNPDTNVSIREHLNRSLQLLSNRENPDYRNSIKESISAVESCCKIIAGSKKGTLGKALAKISENHHIHSSLKDAFSRLYGYTSDEGGIRHSLMDEANITQEDAMFMLVSCSAFVNYLTRKGSPEQGVPK